MPQSGKQELLSVANTQSEDQKMRKYDAENRGGEEEMLNNA